MATLYYCLRWMTHDHIATYPHGHITALLLQVDGFRAIEKALYEMELRTGDPTLSGLCEASHRARVWARPDKWGSWEPWQGSRATATPPISCPRWCH